MNWYLVIKKKYYVRTQLFYLVYRYKLLVEHTLCKTVYFKIFWTKASSFYVIVACKFIRFTHVNIVFVKFQRFQKKCIKLFILIVGDVDLFNGF